MGGARSLAACLEAAEREAQSRVVALPIPAVRSPVNGTAHRLNPVFTEGQSNACPCCNGRAWHVGRITAECAACEAVLPIAPLAGVLPASPANRAEWNSARAACSGLGAGNISDRSLRK